MRIFVARHGQTQWNLEHRVCGRTDIPLTEVGREQARKLAQTAKDKGIDVIIASPLFRARQTAAAIAEACGLPVCIDERIIEQDFGAFEGVSMEDPAFIANRKQFVTRYPGGESMFDVAARIYSILDEIREKYAGKTVLLVCHGAVCRVIRSYFEDMTNEEYVAYMEVNTGLREYNI